ncbi:MAG: hypothetical protein MSH24_02645 [Lachnospiraceae bacterium]|nr:hypothetical protein [Lachnospiraceae bacterium]
MCEAVEKYGERTKKIGVLDGKTEAIEGLMANAKLSLSQALDMIGVKGEERSLITEEVKKRQKAIS